MPEPVPAGTRARRKPPKIDENALSLALVHHIDDLKRGARGRITQVHHIKMGWMTLAEYYDLQKLHEVKADIVPMIAAAIGGGYKLKQAIFQSEFTVEFLGSGASVPVGPALIMLTVAAAAAAHQAGDDKTALILLACLVLPFGEIYLVYLFYDALFGFTKGVVEDVKDAAKGGAFGPLATILSGEAPSPTAFVSPLGGAVEYIGQKTGGQGGVLDLVKWLFFPKGDEPK